MANGVLAGWLLMSAPIAAPQTVTPPLANLTAVDSSRLDIALKQVSARYELPLGLELAPDETMAGGTTGPSQPPFRLQLKALTAVEAVDRLVRLYPRYVWRHEAGVVVVRPRIASNGWLEQRLPAFELKSVTLQAAQHIVYRLYDPAYRDRAMPPAMAAKLALRRGSLDPISVSLKNVTVREILNAVVRAHGRVGWVVTYRSTRSGPRAVLQFFNWDGWSLTTSSDLRDDAPDSKLGIPRIAPPGGRILEPMQRSKELGTTIAIENNVGIIRIAPPAFLDFLPEQRVARSSTISECPVTRPRSSCRAALRRLERPRARIGRRGTSNAKAAALATRAINL